MRETFGQYFPHSPETISSLWKSATFAFDANTLLNLYRYSDNAREEFLQVLRDMQEQIFVPDQAAHEFFRNRTSEIVAQDKAYNDTKKMISDLRSNLTRDRGHPYISEPALFKLGSVLDEVCAELDANQEKQTSRLSSDDIMNDVANVFSGRVGRSFDEAELSAVFDDGLKRFEAKMPPGYADSRKNKDPQTPSEKRSVYGDLIIWRQIIEISKNSSKDIVFVTDDSKEDWWLEVNGRTIGPRPELVAEFTSLTGQKLHMYKPEQFLKFAKDHLKSVVSSETLEEVAAASTHRDDSSHSREEWTEGDDLGAHDLDIINSDKRVNTSITNFFTKSPLRIRHGKTLKPIVYSNAFYAPLRLEIQALNHEKQRILKDLEELELDFEKEDFERDPHFRREVVSVQAMLISQLNEIDKEIHKKYLRLKEKDGNLGEHRD